MRTHTQEPQDSLTPKDALDILIDGNARFCANLKANRNLLQQVNETRDGQFPFAAVLSCIDSRTSAELIVVLGHSQCGAIKGAVDHVELGHLTGMLQKIQPAVGCVLEPRDQAKRTSGNEVFVQAVAVENVKFATEAISKQSTVLNEMKQAGRIDVVGAMYDVASGSVEFLEAS